MHGGTNIEVTCLMFVNFYCMMVDLPKKGEE
jgi:hypothetical protein